MSSNLDLAVRKQDDDSDEHLLRVYAVDPEHATRAFEILFDKYFDRVHAYLLFRGAPSAAAEDMAQEVFVRVVTAARTFDGERGTFRSWLYRIATNLFFDHLRQKGYRRVVPLEKCDVTVGAIPDELLQLDKYMRKMRPELREPLELSAICGLTAPEIAKVLHLPEKTVYTRIHRARRKLREKLDPGAKVKRIAKEAPPKLAKPSPAPAQDYQPVIRFEEEQQ